MMERKKTLNNQVIAFIGDMSEWQHESNQEGRLHACRQAEALGATVKPANEPVDEMTTMLVIGSRLQNQSTNYILAAKNQNQEKGRTALTTDPKKQKQLKEEIGKGGKEGKEGKRGKKKIEFWTAEQFHEFCMVRLKLPRLPPPTIMWNPPVAKFSRSSRSKKRKLRIDFKKSRWGGVSVEYGETLSSPLKTSSLAQHSLFQAMKKHSAHDSGVLSSSSLSLSSSPSFRPVPGPAASLSSSSPPSFSSTYVNSKPFRTPPGKKQISVLRSMYSSCHVPKNSLANQIEFDKVATKFSKMKFLLDSNILCPCLAQYDICTQKRQFRCLNESSGGLQPKLVVTTPYNIMHPTKTNAAYTALRSKPPPKKNPRGFHAQIRVNSIPGMGVGGCRQHNFALQELIKFIMLESGFRQGSEKKASRADDSKMTVASIVAARTHLVSLGLPATFYMNSWHLGDKFYWACGGKKSVQKKMKKFFDFNKGENVKERNAEEVEENKRALIIGTMFVI